MFDMEKIKRPVFDFEDYLFEKWNGFEFSGIISRENLVVDNKESLSHVTAYHAVWCRNVRNLIREASKLGYSYENFIDIGSGKGKACLYAYSKKAFPKILGIELSKPLVDIAEKNKNKIRATGVSFMNGDATVYKLPDEDSLVFMFHPFDAAVLERFISNNLEHFRTRKSAVAYANDVHRASFAKFGFETVFRDQTRKISLYHIPR